MTTCEPGDVVLVRFPLTDHTSTKKRPAVVVSPRSFSEYHGDVVLLALTSVPQEASVAALENWREAGLVKPTWPKPLLGTFSRDVVEKRLGRLTDQDMDRIRRVLKGMIA